MHAHPPCKLQRLVSPTEKWEELITFFSDRVLKDCSKYGSKCLKRLQPLQILLPTHCHFDLPGPYLALKRINLPLLSMPVGAQCRPTHSSKITQNLATEWSNVRDNFWGIKYTVIGFIFFNLSNTLSVCLNFYAFPLVTEQTAQRSRLHKYYQSKTSNNFFLTVRPTGKTVQQTGP